MLDFPNGFPEIYRSSLYKVHRHKHKAVSSTHTGVSKVWMRVYNENPRWRKADICRLFLDLKQQGMAEICDLTSTISHVMTFRIVNLLYIDKRLSQVWEVLLPLYSDYAC